MSKLILPGGMGAASDELLPEDAEWLLRRVESWDKNTLMVARRTGKRPTMKLAIAVGKEMLKSRGVAG